MKRLEKERNAAMELEQERQLKALEHKRTLKRKQRQEKLKRLSGMQEGPLAQRNAMISARTSIVARPFGRMQSESGTSSTKPGRFKKGSITGPVMSKKGSVKFALHRSLSMKTNDPGRLRRDSATMKQLHDNL